MPFTFAHPAIILPLKHIRISKYFSLTALIAGSLVPDFEYFIRMKMESRYSHTLLGVFYFDLPLGLVCCFLFHNIVRNDLFANLPRFLRTRLCAYTGFNWNIFFLKHPILIILSLLVGSLSHLLWDAFTHAYGFFVGIISVLNHAFVINGVSIPVYKMLQHGSSLVGCSILFYVIMKLPKRECSNKIDFRYWIALCSTILIVCATRAAFGLDYRMYVQLIAIFISATLIALVVAPAVIMVWNIGQNRQIVPP